MNLPIFINIFSISLQIVAAILAIRLIVKTKEHVVGLFIFLTAFLMAFRRGIVLYRVITFGSVVTDFYSNISGMLISLMLIIGIIYLTKLITELKDSIKNIKVLQGFFPICSACKKIRDDLGDMNNMEIYVPKHTDADFTHTLCPDCRDRYYTEYLRVK